MLHFRNRSCIISWWARIWSGPFILKHANQRFYWDVNQAINQIKISFYFESCSFQASPVEINVQLCIFVKKTKQNTLPIMCRQNSWRNAASLILLSAKDLTFDFNCIISLKTMYFVGKLAIHIVFQTLFNSRLGHHVVGWGRGSEP